MTCFVCHMHYVVQPAVLHCKCCNDDDKNKSDVQKHFYIPFLRPDADNQAKWATTPSLC